METLTSRQTYAPVLALEIETMGSMAVSVANRWILGWPARLKAGTYLRLLDAQVDQEKDVLANEPGLRHLSRHESLQMYEIREAPP